MESHGTTKQERRKNSVLRNGPSVKIGGLRLGASFVEALEGESCTEKGGYKRVENGILFGSSLAISCVISRSM